MSKKNKWARLEREARVAIARSTDAIVNSDPRGGGKAKPEILRRIRGRR